MVCPNCGTAIDDDAKTCFLCGIRLDTEKSENSQNTHIENNQAPQKPMRCLNCGNLVDNKSNKCSICGAPIYDMYSKQSVSESTVDSKQKENLSKKHIMCIVSIAVVLLISLVAILIIKFVPNLSSDKNKTVATTTTTNVSTEITTIETTITTTELQTTNTTTVSTTAETTTSSNADMSKYIGFWYNDTYGIDRELNITSISDTEVTFTLLYYRLQSLDDILAPLHDDTARFSTGDASGYLAFNESSITIVIEKSDLPYMPAEQFTFTHKYSETRLSEYSNSYNPTEQFVPYTIQVKNPNLNIYDSPSYSGNIVGTITDKQTYTIVEEYIAPGHTSILDTWGKLKSGVGWVNLYDADYDETEYSSNSSYIDDETPNVYCPNCRYSWFTTGIGTEGFTCPNCGFNWNPYE